MVARAASEPGLSGGGGDDEGAVPWTPRQYQLRACKHLLTNAGAALFLDPGLGKTSTTLACIQALKDSKKLRSALIIAPLRPTYLVWPRELRKWIDFHGLTFEVLHGPDKAKALSRKADVYIINPEGLEWLSNQSGIGNRWCTLVVDESTRFKSWGSKRMKLLKNLLPLFKRRWILTGTPAPQGVGDLFSQIYICDGGAALGRYVTHFRSRYMMQAGYKGYQWVPKEGTLEEIQERIAHMVLRLAAEDYLELPELLHNRIEVSLPKDVAKQYREFENEYVLQLKKATITAVTAATLGMKLRQFVGGYVYDENRKPHLVHTAKLDALEELVEELSGKPLLVAVAFLPEVDAIRERLGDVPYLGGGVSTKEADRLCDEWNKGKLPLLLAHPTSVAHGLNLQGGNQLCWFNLTWNLEEYDQLIRRLWRQGQTQRVTVHTIVMEDTIDLNIERALRHKAGVQKALTDRFKL